MKSNPLTTYYYALCVLFIVGCSGGGQQATQSTTEDYRFFVGTYTDGDSDGIYSYRLSAEGEIKDKKLEAFAVNPSFLALNEQNTLLFAVNEVDSGWVESFAVKEDTIMPVSKAYAGGDYPCFVTSVNDYILTANYGTGTVALLSTDSTGMLDLLDIQQHAGTGISERQEGPHAHSVWVEAPTEEVIAVDLGTNSLWLSSIAGDSLSPREPGSIPMKEGAGPRHLVFHPSTAWIYVLNELDATITHIDNRTGDYEVKESVSLLPEGYEGSKWSADIHITGDGKFVYASNRGHNSIAIFSINAEDGSLVLVGHEPARGEVPRNFALTPDDQFLLVAHQYTNQLISFKRNAQSGLLTFVDSVYAPNPVCILFQ